MKSGFKLLFVFAVVALLYESNPEIKKFENSNSELADDPEESFSTSILSSITNFESGCDPALWNYVYHSSRLKMYEACKTVSGTVIGKHDEADGDIHLQLRMTGNSNLLNSKNLTEQNGCLVLEIICAKKVTQADAIGPCSGYYNNIIVPGIGDQISVSGSYVLDTNHGWNEIHPVSSLTIISKGDPNAYDKNPIVGKTATGIPIHVGPKGGHYHYSKSGNKVYEKK
ncbi:MAG: hypothetical protein WCI97_11580 [Bacteroidota bacterium]